MIQPTAYRIFRGVVTISILLLVGTVLVFFAGYFVKPRTQFISITPDCHVTVRSRGFDSRVMFFSDSEYGPYSGSIIGLVGADGKTDHRMRGFGDKWGIYFRIIEWTDATMWTLMVSLWYPILVFVIMPTIYLFAISIRRRGDNNGSATSQTTTTAMLYQS